jgi:cold shock CspA family protein
VRGDIAALRVGTPVAFVFAEGDRGSKADDVEIL